MASVNPDRRKFLFLTACSMGVLAAGGAAWVLIDSMNPAADTLADVGQTDLSHIQPGQRAIAAWNRLPIFICRRSKREIDAIRSEDWRALREPQSDDSRVQKGHDEWLVLIGICTRKDCILKGNKPMEPTGFWRGWFCPCCGSSYDRSGRIRSGPAPKNLVVPGYVFITETFIQYRPALLPLR